MPKPIVHARASNYRAAGVKLKKMPRNPKNKLDVNQLNRLIEGLNRENPHRPAKRLAKDKKDRTTPHSRRNQDRVCR